MSRRAWRGGGAAEGVAVAHVMNDASLEQGVARSSLRSAAQRQPLRDDERLARRRLQRTGRYRSPAAACAIARAKMCLRGRHDTRRFSGALSRRVSVMWKNHVLEHVRIAPAHAASPPAAPSAGTPPAGQLRRRSAARGRHRAARRRHRPAPATAGRRGLAQREKAVHVGHRQRRQIERGEPAARVHRALRSTSDHATLRPSASAASVWRGSRRARGSAVTSAMPAMSGWTPARRSPDRGPATARVRRTADRPAAGA